jgi:outer membrane protein, heavy metal efflux system
MSLERTAQGCALIFFLCGCQSAQTRIGTPRAPQPVAAVTTTDCEASFDATPLRTNVRPVSHEEQAAADEQSVAPGDDPFAAQSELSLDRLVAEVESRNPSLQAAVADWGAAAQRYPQVIALDDPMFQSMFAPGTFGASDVQASYSFGVSQKVPWPGKLALRGQIAQAEANAAALDSQEVRLRLSEAARIAFFDYYLAFRELELNAANSAALREFRKTANAKYEASRVTQQDVLQADVELAKLDSREIELKRNARVAVARINALLHRNPDDSLPPPPKQLVIRSDHLAGPALQELALHRPELAAEASRIQSEQSAVELARKEYYPDFEVVGRYDQFWTPPDQRGQIGVNVNIPLNQSRRQAAVREAQFRLRKMQAEYDASVDSIRRDVEAGVARLDAARVTVVLYDQKIIPAARRNVESASIGYTAGTIDFLRLIDAERELIELQEKQQNAIADYHRRAAELERVIGTGLP